MKISTLILTILVCFSTIVDAQVTQNRANELMKQAQSSVIFSSRPMALSQRRKIIRKPWNAEFREQLCTIVKIITKRHSTSVEEWIS